MSSFSNQFFIIKKPSSLYRDESYFAVPPCLWPIDHLLCSDTPGYPSPYIGGHPSKPTRTAVLWVGYSKASSHIITALLSTSQQLSLPALLCYYSSSPYWFHFFFNIIRTKIKICQGNFFSHNSRRFRAIFSGYLCK